MLWFYKVIKINASYNVFHLLSFNLTQKKVTKKSSRLNTNIGDSKAKAFITPAKA